MVEIPTPYTAGKPALKESAEDLRARIPGWGADLDPMDRPSYPREQPGIETGAHWDFPERQEAKWPRERSIEHAFMTPVFGTSTPPRGGIRCHPEVRLQVQRGPSRALVTAHRSGQGGRLGTPPELVRHSSPGQSGHRDGGAQ